MIRSSLTSFALAGIFTFIGSVLDTEKPAQGGPEAAKKARDVAVPSAGVAVLFPTEDSEAQGVVVFETHGDRVAIRGRVVGLEPGKHGFHIHEFGDLRSKDGKSAGGHFAPGGEKHGGPESEEHHAGDLGNIEANEDGVAEFKMVTDNFRLHHILGRAVVVHAGADDLKSQPAGDAGGRVCLGVVGVANEKLGQAE